MKPRGARAGDEIEIKLGLAPDAAPAVLAHRALADVKQGVARKRKVDSLYYDTPDGRLARAGMALRVRRADGRWVQTLKGPPGKAAGGALSARAEYETPLPRAIRPPKLDLETLRRAPHGKRVLVAAKSGLRPVFVTSFERTTVPLAFADGTRAELAIDVGEVCARPGGETRSVPISEVEIELVKGDRARLYDLALALSRDVPFAAESRSKAQRGYVLANAVLPSPAHAERIELEPAATTAAALSAQLASALRQIEANAAGALDSDDPEWIHQLRVGVRRARAVLWLARKLLPAETSRSIRDELRWLGRSLGTARDLDVFVTETLPKLVIAAGNDASASRCLRRLERTASEHAARARQRARGALKSPRFGRLLLSAGALLAARHLGNAEDSDAARRLAEPAARFAAKSLARVHRTVAAGVDDIAALSPTERHKLRIAVKKLRYGVEAIGSLLPRKRVRAYRTALVSLQTMLGAANDVEVARSLCRRLVPDGTSIPALVATLDDSSDAAASARMTKAWRRFQDAAAACFD